MEQNLVAAPVLCVVSMAESIAFYERCFGFTRQDYFNGNKSYIVLTRGAAEIHFMQAERANPNNKNSVLVADVFIWVEDIEPICVAAAANGLIAQRGPTRYDTSPVATTEVVFEDNSSYWVCFAVAYRG